MTRRFMNAGTLPQRLTARNDAKPVTVEVDLGPGLPGLQLVGLADAAIQESRERVRAALRNSGFRGPWCAWW